MKSKTPLESFNPLIELILENKGKFLEAVGYREREAIVNKEVHEKVFILVQNGDIDGMKNIFANEYRQDLICCVYCLRGNNELRMDFDEAYDLIEWDLTS